MPGDYNSHRTLFAGPDPADPQRVLVRKLVQTSEKVWCFEEARISPSDDGKPTVHTTMHRLGWFDICEAMSDQEMALRLQYRAMPNVIGFSLFQRSGAFSIVENSLSKKTSQRWAAWFSDF